MTYRHVSILRLWYLIGLLLVGSGVAWPWTSVAAPAQQDNTPTATPVPPGFMPDRCEPNDTLVQPCAIPTEVETTNLTFVNGDTTDVYSVLLKANRLYAITARSTTGIDPAITVYLAGATETPLAQNDDLAPGSGDAGVQIATTADGWYLIDVTNNAPGDMRGRVYSLSVRSSAPTSGTPTSGTPTPPTPTTVGDAFENNWHVETAPTLAWDVPYDLSLICPETRPNACPSGDHDFFLVDIKRGVPFAALTYDLGPGADTTLALYQPVAGVTDPSTHLVGWQLRQGNDDALRGHTLRSQLMLTPDWDGQALLIVAASDRTDPPRVPDAVGPSGRYRLIVGSPFMPGVQAVLAAQQESQGTQPTATARPDAGTPDGSPHTPTAAPAPPTAPRSTSGPTVLPTPASAGSDAEEVIREACLTGMAVVINPDGARFSAAAVPTKETRILMVYPEGTEVQLLGECYLGWVKVRPLTGVTPGWMYAPDLQMVEATGMTAPTTPMTGTHQLTASSPTPFMPGNAVPTARPIQISPLPPRTPPAATPLPRQAVSVAVQIVDGDNRPRPGLRVQLTNVWGHVLREGTTDVQGQITLVADLSPQAAVWVQVPAAGLTVRVDRAKPTVQIVLPRGGT